MSDVHAAWEVSGAVFGWAMGYGVGRIADGLSLLMEQENGGGECCQAAFGGSVVGRRLGG